LKHTDLSSVPIIKNQSVYAYLLFFLYKKKYRLGYIESNSPIAYTKAKEEFLHE